MWLPGGSRCLTMEARSLTLPSSPLRQHRLRRRRQLQTRPQSRRRRRPQCRRRRRLQCRPQSIVDTNKRTHCIQRRQTEGTITWLTNVSSDSQVESGVSNAYEKSQLKNSLSLNHRINLRYLTSDALYHYRVRSRDSAANLAVSGDFTFMTASN